MELRPAKCEQAAQFVSLDLDGELSQFERALLDRHLSRCARCAQEAHRTRAVTTQLRSQSLEQMSVPVGVSRRRTRLSVVQSVGAVAAVAVVAVGGTWLGLSMSDQRPSRPVVHIRPPAAPVASQVILADDLDWQAGGPSRGQRFIQYVPGGLHRADS